MSARLAVLAAALLAACTVGPDYVPPTPLDPGTFRGAENTEESFADLPWNDVFRDPVLQDLVRTALRNNYDVRLAAERVLEARARYTIVDADNYPQFDAVADAAWRRASGNGSTPLPAGLDRDSRDFSAGGRLTWELDFWGRFDRASEAARADLLATEFGRVVVLQTLVTDLAAAYVVLLELDAELDIARRTLESREQSAELVRLRLEQGVANMVEMRQAQNLVLTTARIIPALQLEITRQENFIRLLVGDLPGSVPRTDLAANRELEVDVPPGLPSQLLERRPDVLAAEMDLVAANARIGEARALLYPSVQLTATGGGASEDLDELTHAGSGFWSIVPTVTLPIFNAGRLRANVDVTESQQRQAALEYLATLQNAFREVADALVTHERTRDVRGVQEEIRATLSDQLELSRDRYRGGVTSYLEVLDTERSHFEAELDLVRAIRDEMLATIELYRSLGGGWQGTAADAARGVQQVARGTDGDGDVSGDGDGAADGD